MSSGLLVFLVIIVVVVFINGELEQIRIALKRIADALEKEVE
jgi:ABC-type protease/lipase transport system fused ATPase/permease subunit